LRSGNLEDLNILLRPASVLALVCLQACNGALHRESGALAEAVDRYRKAAPAQKGPARQAVLAVACSAPDVCTAKQVCLAAIDSTLQAFALKDEVAARIADVQEKRIARDSPEAEALPGKLEAAERLLQEGWAEMSKCDAQLAALAAKHGA
jgi:hypothetical protein